MNLLCLLVLRHDRDLNALHHQNTYILFLSTGSDSLAASECSVGATTAEQSRQPVPEAMSYPELDANLAAESQQGEGMQEGRSPLDLKPTEQAEFYRMPRGLASRRITPRRPWTWMGKGPVSP